METKTTNSISKKSIIVCVTIFLLILLGFLFFKDFYTKIYFYFTDFALHHYFYLSFIVFVLAMVFVKSYFSRQERKIQIEKYNLQIELLKISVLIDNSQINAINFVSDEVLNSDVEKIERIRDIALSYKLGFYLRKKVRIFFKQIELNSYIDDLVVYKNSNFIRLKSGLLIPIKSIYTIEFLNKK